MSYYPNHTLIRLILEDIEHNAEENHRTRVPLPDNTVYSRPDIERHMILCEDRGWLILSDSFGGDDLRVRGFLTTSGSRYLGELSRIQGPGD